MTDKINIEIDGNQYSVDAGKMIIEVTDDLGIYIPRFCYHKKLSIAANCRMCLVEVERAPKELPACATPLTQGMKIFTKTARARAAQKAVMEFLLINHPLDCPICDQGGECELQDLALGYGKDVSRYNEGKRSVDDKNIGPLIATDMTRCIHCTRCVRFGEEVAGLRELGAINRGENMEISTFIEHSLQSEISGNVIDLCPVGALTSKPYRFTARPWELKQFPSIAPHDCLGSNIYMHVLRNEVMRVVPKDNEAINEAWISDRDRYSYTAIHHPDRITKPRIRRNHVWEEVDWQTALEFLRSRMQRVLDEQGASQIGGLISPNATIEEHFLFQKWLRTLGIQNIDHRIRQLDFADQDSAPLFPKLSLPLAEIENQEALWLVGINVHREQPLLGIRVRKAALRGASVWLHHSINYSMNFPLTQKSITSPDELPLAIARVVKALMTQKNATKPELKELLDTITPTAEDNAIAQKLLNATQKVILMGAFVQRHPKASLIRSLLQYAAELCGSHYGELTEGANAAGAWIAGALPHREVGGRGVMKAGLNAQQMFEKRLKAYVLAGIEPEFDLANPAQAIHALEQAECVIVLSSFITQTMQNYAHVILPTATFAESAGTYVNVEGTWQSTQPSISLLDQAKPTWKVLRVLGNIFELNGFDQRTIEDVSSEIQKIIVKLPNAIGFWHAPTQNALASNKTTKVQRMTDWAIYGGDSLVRRAEPLQQCASQDVVGILMNIKTATQFNVKQGDVVVVKQSDGEAKLNVVVDERIPNNTVLTFAGLATVQGHLGRSFEDIELHAQVGL